MLHAVLRKVSSPSSAVSPEWGSHSQPGNRAGWQQLHLVCSKKIKFYFLGGIKRAVKLVIEKNDSQLCQDPVCSMQETGFVRFAVLHLFTFVLQHFNLIKLHSRPANAR